MITKMELVEGELGRFAMIRGEEPTQTYNRLKTLVKERHTCLMVALAFTSIHSSPTNAIHVLWPRKRRYIFEIPPSTLLLAMRNLLMMR
jgi:hypothetical protein